MKPTMPPSVAPMQPTMQPAASKKGKVSKVAAAKAPAAFGQFPMKRARGGRVFDDQMSVEGAEPMKRLDRAPRVAVFAPGGSAPGRGMGPPMLPPGMGGPPMGPPPTGGPMAPPMGPPMGAPMGTGGPMLPPAMRGPMSPMNNAMPPMGPRPAFARGGAVRKCADGGVVMETVTQQGQSGVDAGRKKK